MNQNSKNSVCGERSMPHRLIGILKGLTAAVLAVLMVIGTTGCALDDLTSFFTGDVPFEQEQTTPPEMGAVDNRPTVADDAAFDGIDSNPLLPMN